MAQQILPTKTPGTQRRILCGLYFFVGNTPDYDYHNTAHIATIIKNEVAQYKRYAIL
jgi:hypothetical protein